MRGFESVNSSNRDVFFYEIKLYKNKSKLKNMIIMQNNKMKPKKNVFLN